MKRILYGTKLSSFILDHSSLYLWSGRRDSNSRNEFGRLGCFQLHHSRKEFWILDFGFLSDISISADCQNIHQGRIGNHNSRIENVLGPLIGLEPTPNSFEANRSSVKLQGRGKFRISNCGFDDEVVLSTRHSMKFEIRIPKSEFFVWSGRTELNCRLEFPGLECSRYTTPRRKFRIADFGN